MGTRSMVASVRADLRDELQGVGPQMSPIAAAWCFLFVLGIILTVLSFSAGPSEIAWTAGAVTAGGGVALWKDH